MQQINKLQNSLSINSDENSISIYRRDKLSNKCIVQQTNKIKNAFPSLSIEFYDILFDRIKDLGFSDKKLNDAVNHMIDNCIYPVPTIANIISFDKRIKVYTYNEICDMVNLYGKETFKYYRPIILDDYKNLWASMSDIMKYKLEFKKFKK